MDKKISKKHSPVKSAVAKKPAATTLNTPSKTNINAIVFFIIIAISYVVFINNYFNIKELTNPYIKLHAQWIVSFQFLLYTLIYVVFGYFGYLFVSGKSENKTTTILTLVGFAAIILLHYIAFNKAFEDVDDNASYMIAAKSLVDKHAPYYLYMPIMKPDTEGAIGLPIMLIPFYLIWGMNYVPMEIMIFFTLIGSVIMSFLLFRKMEGTIFAVIITLLFATHPYIVSFSSIIMTEIPYIFWSLLALFLCLKFEETPKVNYFLLVAAVLSIFMTYLTRAIGAGFVVAAILYFLIKSNFWKNIKTKKMAIIKEVAVMKFLLISALLVVCMLAYQVWARSLGGSSQADILSKMSLVDQFSKNLSLVWQVLSQNIFCGALARYEVNPKLLEPVSILWALVFLITFAGMVYSLFKKQLVGLYFIFVMLVLLVGNVATQAFVVSRYLIVFTPFMIYFLYLGVKGLIGLLDKKKQIAKTAGILVMCFLMGNSFIGDAFNVQRSKKETMYAPPYQAFLDCAVWAKDNLPKDAIVASRKERIFFIFSGGLRGYKHIASNEISRLQDKGTTLEEFEQNKLKQIATNNTDYLILDTFNSASVQLIYPIIEKNPDKFKLIKKIGDDQTGPCFVFQVVKWWK
ncbi:MAG: phospholipid carrier-dependent glycosyltransferase [Bacteroidota bacterium]